MVLVDESSRLWMCILGIPGVTSTRDLHSLDVQKVHRISKMRHRRAQWYSSPGQYAQSALQRQQYYPQNLGSTAEIRT